MITVRHCKKPAPDQRRTVRLEGREIGSPVSLFLVDVEPGRGSELHIHPYTETWIIQSGEAEFTVGEETLHGSAGDVVVGPAHVPHRFTNVGTGRLEIVAIHPSATIQQINVQSVMPHHS
jgi:mannose-6-phosphate isomerase-like protein (cupin superfamily)